MEGRTRDVCVDYLLIPLNVGQCHRTMMTGPHATQMHNSNRASGGRPASLGFQCDPQLNFTINGKGKVR